MELLNTDFAALSKEDAISIILDMFQDLMGYHGSVKLTALAIGVDYDATREQLRLRGSDKPRMPSGESVLKIMGAWVKLKGAQLFDVQNVCFIREDPHTKTKYVCEPHLQTEIGDVVIYDDGIGTLSFVDVQLSDDHDPVVVPFIDYWGSHGRAQVRERINHRVIGRLAPLHDVDDL